jgi:hypothetical protein
VLGDRRRQQPLRDSEVSNCVIVDCSAASRAGAFALQQTIYLGFENINISRCSAPDAAAVAMGSQRTLKFVGFSSWTGSFAVGEQGRALNCVFFNSSFPAARGNVFNAVECAFRDIAEFEGLVTVHKCWFSGADALGGLEAGGNVFGADVQEPEERCPTPTPEAGLNPYEIKRKVVRNAVFRQFVPVPE